MSDLVGNPKDQFSHNKAHMNYDAIEMSTSKISSNIAHFIQVFFSLGFFKGVVVPNVTQKLCVVIGWYGGRELCTIYKSIKK